MADARIKNLRADRRKALREAKRAGQRRADYLRRAKAARRRGEHKKARVFLNDAQSALVVKRRKNDDAQKLLKDIRARRTSLKYKLKLKAKPGTVYFDGKQVASWIAPILQAARASGVWKGGVNSGYRSYAQQWIIYFVKRIRPAAYPGRSNHEGYAYPRGAVDVSDPWGLNRYIDRENITKLKWYRDTLGPGDDWHFSGTGR